MKASCCYSSCWKFQPFRFPFHLFTDIHHHISYDMYLSSHTRGIPKKSGPSDQFRTYSGPLLALRSGSGPSPEFRTLLVPLELRLPKIFYLESIIQLGVPQTCRPGHDVPLLTVERWHIFADLLHHLQGVHLQGFDVFIGGNTNFQKNLPFQCSSPLQAGHQQNYLGQSLESPKS